MPVYVTVILPGDSTATSLAGGHLTTRHPLKALYDHPWRRIVAFPAGSAAGLHTARFAVAIRAAGRS